MAKGFQGPLLAMPFFFFYPPLLWKIPPFILSPSTPQPCLKWLQLKRSEGHWREVPGAPFPIHLLLSSHDKFSSGRAIAKEAAGAQGQEEEKQELESVTVPCLRGGWAVPRESHSYTRRQNGSQWCCSNNNLEAGNCASTGKSHCGMEWMCQKPAGQG